MLCIFHRLNEENLNRGDNAHTVSSCSCQGEVSARVCNQFIALVPIAAEKHRALDGTREQPQSPWLHSPFK